jgi:hypothetical protein
MVTIHKLSLAMFADIESPQNAAISMDHGRPEGPPAVTPLRLLTRQTF